MTKIIPVKIFYNVSACYNPYKDEIMYDKDLDKFPNLKTFVLQHEINHAKKPKNYLWHIFLDAKDYTKQLFLEDYYKFGYYKKKEYTQNKSVNWFGDFIYGVFQTLINVFIVVIGLFMELYFYFKKRVKGKRWLT